MEEDISSIRMISTPCFMGTPEAEISTRAMPEDWKSMPVPVLLTLTAPSSGYSG